MPIDAGDRDDWLTHRTDTIARTMWKRRLTVIAGQTRPDDWTIIYEKWKVGRIQFADYPPRGPHWSWAVWTIPGRSGSEATFEDAVHALRAAMTYIDGRPNLHSQVIDYLA